MILIVAVLLINKEYQGPVGQSIVSLTSLLRGQLVGPWSAVDRAPDSKVRGPGFDSRSGHTLSFLLPLIQDGQLLVTGKSMCTKYWLTT